MRNKKKQTVRMNGAVPGSAKAAEEQRRAPVRRRKGFWMKTPDTAEKNIVAEGAENNKKENFYHIVKRIFDVLASAVLLVVLLPLFLVISIVVYVGDPGQVIYGHIRIGKNGKPFKMWKFRSMYMDSDKIIERLSPEQKQQYYTEFKIDNDPRVTPVGDFLRKTSLDELPQLVNVLCNEMSLVGPRPLIESEVHTYYADTYETLLSVKPGITGYWQAYARNNATYESGERQRMEMYYVSHASLGLDVKILLKTVVSVLKMDGAQ